MIIIKYISYFLVITTISSCVSKSRYNELQIEKEFFINENSKLIKELKSLNNELKLLKDKKDTSKKTNSKSNTKIVTKLTQDGKEPILFIDEFDVKKPPIKSNNFKEKTITFDDIAAEIEKKKKLKKNPLNYTGGIDKTIVID